MKKTIMGNFTTPRFSQSPVKQWLYLVLLSCTASGVGCSTYGTVTVSDPQVFTRERLIQERYDEYQWMGRQLDKTPTESRFQGLRDFRKFMGIHNNLALQFDPLQGAVDALSQKGKILDNETAYLKKRLEKEKAERALREYIAGVSSTTQEISATEPQGNGEHKATGQSPSVSTSKSGEGPKESSESGAGQKEDKLKLAQIRKDLEPLPKGSDAEKIDDDVHPGIADLFHDQLAYRNIVRAAMRERQLDDSHDLFGMMLYDLQFDITLQPGDHSERYAKVLLTLTAPPCPKKQDSASGDKSTSDKSHVPGDLQKEGVCDDLYHNYVEQLRRQIAEKIVTLQQAYMGSGLSRHDRKWLAQSIKFLLPQAMKALNSETMGTREDLVSAAQTIQKESMPKGEYETHSKSSERTAHAAIKFLEEIALDTLAKTNTVEQLRAQSSARTPEATKCDNLTGLKRALCKAPTDNKQSLFKELKQVEKTEVADQEITKLVQYFNEHGIDDVLDGKLRFRHKNAVKTAILWAVWDHYRDLKRFVAMTPPPPTDPHFESQSDTPFIVGISAGTDEQKRDFESRLRAAGKRSVAYSIEPKEYAQNISDVAAQERLVSLVMQLKATLPQYGITANNYSEYVNRTQEFVQAINRKPLAIGYGGGSNSFGWILGPKFAVAQPRPLLWWFRNLFIGSSLVEFAHTPVRHTFRASVVVPAWWRNVNIEAKSRWIDVNGEDVVAQGGWTIVDRNKNPMHKITASLPIPPESWLAITEALLQADRDSQPSPRISYPDPTRTDRNSLELKEYDPNATETHHQTLLIEGEDLWRNPEVYVGGVKASHVHIAPDMKGLYAIFDFQKDVTDPLKRTLLPKLIDKGNKPLDLTVVTSGGRDTVPNGVIYVAKTRLAESASPPVTLKSTFVIGKQGTITFAVNNLGGYHSLVLNVRPANKANAEFWTSRADLNWNENRSAITTNLSMIYNGNVQVRDLRTQELELRMSVKKFADATLEDVLTKDNRTIVYFANDTDSKFALVKNTLTFEKLPLENQPSYSAAEPVTLRIPLHDNDLFYKAYPGLKEGAERGDGSLTIVLEGGDNTGMPPLSFDAIYAPAKGEEKRDMFYISKNALNNRIRDLTIRDGGTYKVSVQFGNTTIMTNGLLTLRCNRCN